MEREGAKHFGMLQECAYIMYRTMLTCVIESEFTFSAVLQHFHAAEVSVKIKQLRAVYQMDCKIYVPSGFEALKYCQVQLCYGEYNAHPIKHEYTVIQYTYL